MKIKILLLLAGLLWCGASRVQAQSKAHFEPVVWPQLELQYQLPDSSYFFLQTQFRHNTDDIYPGLSDSGPFSRVERVQLRAGYEHVLTERWRAGLSERFAFDAGSDALFSEVFVRHMGHIQSLGFMKMARFEHVYRQRFINQEKDWKGSGRVRLQAALYKDFRLNNRLLRPSFSYELFFDVPFEEENTDTRTVDRTRMRIEVLYEVLPRFFVAPYFTRQTDYLIVLNMGDGQTPVAEKSNRNFITPVIGLDLRYIWSKNERVQVPFTL